MAAIDPLNLVSCRVAGKAGMRFERLEHKPDGQAIRVHLRERPAAHQHAYSREHLS
jgi:hypothetical protein